jgi:mannose-1-phosphate guanylyltransferase
MRFAVIMAGGAGERFWPLSRRLRPKQLLNLTSPDRCLLAEAVSRLLPIVPAERILVVTGEHLVEPLRAAQVGVPAANVVAEPCKRNTAGCLAFAAALACQRFGPAASVTMAVVTADHQIGDAAGFQATVAAALAAAEQHEALVTIGIRPTRPETGYGYVELAESATPVPTGTTGIPVFPAVRFREKPDRATAQEFLAAGRFLWNSGMFFWRVSTFLAETAAANPQTARVIDAMLQALHAGDQAKLAVEFATLPDISIDYALLEKARRVLVVPADFPWDDIGAWDALDRTFPHDAAGNVAIGEPLLADTRNCIVCNEPGAAAMAVGVVGLDNVAVIVARDAVLVVPKERAQDVRAIVAQLKKRNAPQL